MSNKAKLVKFIVVKTLNIPIILGNEDCKRLKLVSYNCNSVSLLTEAETFKRKTQCPPTVADISLGPPVSGINLCPPITDPDITTDPPPRGERT